MLPSSRASHSGCVSTREIVVGRGRCRSLQRESPDGLVGFEFGGLFDYNVSSLVNMERAKHPWST